MNLAIYARYSSELQNPRSVDDQIRVCTERAEREDWKFYDCYSAPAISGASMDRPGLQQLLRDARGGRFEIILAEALDRLSRDQADTATIFKRMKFAGIDIVTLSEGRVGIRIPESHRRTCWLARAKVLGRGRPFYGRKGFSYTLAIAA